MGSCALIALAACTTEIPDSAAGLPDYWSNSSTQPGASTDAAAAVPSARAVSDETLKTLEATGTTTTATAVAAPVTTTSTATAAVATTSAAQAGAAADDGLVHASPSNPPPVIVDSSGISDENDFGAVGERRSIETDAAQRERNRANYQVIEPGAVPTRVASGPNIVAYAIGTKNPVGTRIYNRVGFNAKTRFDKNCAKYPSDDQAQAAFLTKGGPKVDRMGLDPDGDGFACNWNPTPFRAASGG